jgi:hypothetical protein
MLSRKAAEEARHGWHGKWAEYVDRNGVAHHMRSSWEVRFAKHLDASGLTWSYEPTTLRLSTGRRYLPDFWVEEWGTYVEIKGWANPRGMDKVAQAQRDGHRVAPLVGPAFESFLAAGAVAIPA